MSNTNFSTNSFQETAQATGREKITLSLTEWGVFISSILLSLGGCIGMIMTNFRKSNCSEISCCGISKCTRKNLN